MTYWLDQHLAGLGLSIDNGPSFTGNVTRKTESLYKLTRHLPWAHTGWRMRRALFSDPASAIMLSSLVGDFYEGSLIKN
jgi:hypothetical protein